MSGKENFLFYADPKSLREIVETFDVEIPDGRKTRKAMIDAIISDERLTLREIIDEIFDNKDMQLLVHRNLIDDFLEEYNLKSPVSRELCISVICAFFGDIDSVPKEHLWHARKFVNSRGTIENMAAKPNLIDKKEPFLPPDQVVDNISSSELFFGIMELLFVWPGKIILWIEYYFPKKGNVLVSGRRKDNRTVQILFSLWFWGITAILGFMFINSQTQGMRQSETKQTVDTSTRIVPSDQATMPPESKPQPGQPTNAQGGPPQAPRPISRVDPKYPSRAEERERGGSVLLSIDIDKSGGVTQAIVVSESPEGFGFGESAQAAVLQWKFAAGQPGQYQITISYRME